MPKMIVSIDGVVIKEVQLTKDRTTLGRRPYNDIVIDNLAVSGEHAVLAMSGAEVYLEDLNSTNGTYINGKAVKKQLLANNDTVEIGKYKIKFIHEQAPGFGGAEKTVILKPGAILPPIKPPAAPAVGGAPAAHPPAPPRRGRRARRTCVRGRPGGRSRPAQCQHQGAFGRCRGPAGAA